MKNIFFIFCLMSYIIYGQVFDDGEEVKRYQADISFTMKADVKEVQAYIDEILANKF